MMQTYAAPQMMEQQMVETIAAPQMMQTYAQPQMMMQQKAPVTTSVVQAAPVIIGTQTMQMQQIIGEAAPAVYIQAPAPVVETREIVREVIVPQVQTIEKIVQIPQVQLQE